MAKENLDLKGENKPEEASPLGEMPTQEDGSLEPLSGEAKNWRQVVLEAITPKKGVMRKKPESEINTTQEENLVTKKKKWRIFNFSKKRLLWFTVLIVISVVIFFGIKQALK